MLTESSQRAHSPAQRSSDSDTLTTNRVTHHREYTYVATSGLSSMFNLASVEHVAYVRRWTRSPHSGSAVKGYRPKA